MKIKIGDQEVQVSQLSLSSLDALRVAVISNSFGQIRAQRLINDPVLGCTYNWDNEKRIYGTIQEALKENIDWINK